MRCALLYRARGPAPPSPLSGHKVVRSALRTPSSAASPVSLSTDHSPALLSASALASPSVVARALDFGEAKSPSPQSYRVASRASVDEEVIAAACELWSRLTVNTIKTTSQYQELAKAKAGVSGKRKAELIALIVASFPHAPQTGSVAGATTRLRGCSRSARAPHASRVGGADHPADQSDCRVPVLQRPFQTPQSRSDRPSPHSYLK
jgi:hypothetical protein